MNHGSLVSGPESVVPALLRIIAAFAIALAAGAFSALLARTHKPLCAFISLAAGTLLGVTVCGVAPERLDPLGVSDFWLALVLANAGGGFFYLAVHAVLGEILKHHKRLVLANFAAGFSVIAALILYFHFKA